MIVGRIFYFERITHLALVEARVPHGLSQMQGELLTVKSEDAYVTYIPDERCYLLSSMDEHAEHVAVIPEHRLIAAVNLGNTDDES